jgi:predicted nucleic acid-binding protein
MTAEVLNETTHELGKRITFLIQRGLLDEDLGIGLFHEIALVLASRVTIVFSDEYAHRLTEARWRIPRDPRDVSSVALALALDCGIWTHDQDFFGCGLPVWATDVLGQYLHEAQGEDENPSRHR